MVKTFHPHELLLNLTNNLVLKRIDKYVTFSNLTIYYPWKNVKNSYKNNEFNISFPTWNDKLELPDKSYSVLDI